MMQVAVERRPTLLFLIVLAVLFLLMSTSQRTRVVGETRTLFERTVMTLFSPVPKAVNQVGQGGLDIYHGYLDMRRAVSENVQLRRRLAELTQENLILRRSNSDLARMRSLLSYSEEFTIPTLLAEIVMVDTSGRFKSAILDRGSDHGVEINDVVVHPSGLVGRVILTTKDLSKIQLVIDRGASVGSLVERSRRQGVVIGSDRGLLSMEYVPNMSDVVVGDLILTAGIDGVFPKGVPIGKVVQTEEGADLFKNVMVQPSVDFRSVEEVLILHTRKIPAEVARYQP
ncbi:MAG TPA: rod shape-determining protein MreC [Thermoanaerobaculia bacterium]|nr:rod shape-determining protein MreC [Thermoanaerobaculia bacterium]